MARGLAWLPLLGMFVWLAWAGWNEFQKVEAYKTWAESFDRAKYDIYAVLGQKGNDLTWGKPTRKGPIDLHTFSLHQVKGIQLWVDNQSTDLEHLPQQGRQVAIEFQVQEAEIPIRVPFTEISLAAQWTEALCKDWKNLRNSEIES